MSDEAAAAPSFIHQLSANLNGRRLVLIGGKGGAGKTTVACALALHRAHAQRTILFTTDPASNLGDIFKGRAPSGNLVLEALNAEQLYARFLERNLASFLKLGDRGTYLEKDELRRFFELSLPGVDELMAWLHIGELAESDPEAAIVVDTAPTGHTLRMLGSSEHFREIAAALDAMQEKHRGMVRQFTRRDVRDAMDEFIERFADDAARRRALLTSPAAAFVPVFLDEPWVIEQTRRLIAEVRAGGIEVPVAVLNRARRDVDISVPVVRAPESPRPLDTPESIERWSTGRLGSAGFQPAGPAASSRGNAPSPIRLAPAPLTFFAGKGGVGKTTLSAATALRLAQARKVTLISVDPAHSVRDVFARETPPPNLTVEVIDTKGEWQAFRDRMGAEVERAVNALAPRGMSVAYDIEAMQKLVEIAPPGADELFAVNRLADLVQGGQTVIVDTAPTGHFLRLIDLPRTAGEWVHELMRTLLHYKELVHPGMLGEELLRASKALTALDEAMHSDRCTVLVVTRPEPVVMAETHRLIGELKQRGLSIGAVIANYVTDETVADDSLVVRRRDTPPVTLAELTAMVEV